MMLSVQSLRENQTEEGAPHVVGVHVEWKVVKAGERRVAVGKGWRREVLNSFGVPSFIRSKVDLLD